jgi:putative ABC transport system permease protein
MNAPIVRISDRGRPGSAILPLRFALRELRGGLRGFYVFILCIALGVMAIAGVGAVAAGLADGLSREGRLILGGDLAFSLSLREATGEEQAFIHSHGRMSLAATMRAMARTQDGRTALVEMKAVDATYPLYGPVTLNPPQALSDALAQRDGAYGAAADSALMARLDLKPVPVLRSAPHPSKSAPCSHPNRTNSSAASASVRACSSAKRRCVPPASSNRAASCAGTTGCGFPTTPPATKP